MYMYLLIDYVYILMNSSVPGHHPGAVQQIPAMSHMLWPTVYSANETWLFFLGGESVMQSSEGQGTQPRSCKSGSGSRPLGL